MDNLNDNDNYYYNMLVPPEVILDVLSFTTGIELSKIRTAHRYFKKIINYYSNSLPDMTIQKLDIIMDPDRYLDSILLTKNINKEPLVFMTFRDLLAFINTHPMPINHLTFVNTIWISKFAVVLSQTVPISKVEFRHEENSRYFSHSGEGGIAFIGKILHDPGQVNSHILMDDYYTYFNDTVNKQPRFPANRQIFTLHLNPPSNFECSIIHFYNQPDMTHSFEDILDWIIGKKYSTPNDDAGRVLIADYYTFNVQLPELVDHILTESEGYIRLFSALSPFTILFKQVGPAHRLHPDFLKPTVRKYQFNGGKFLAGPLCVDISQKVQTLIGSQEDEAVVPTRLATEYADQQFDYIIRYKQRVEFPYCSASTSGSGK